MPNKAKLSKPKPTDPQPVNPKPETKREESLAALNALVDGWNKQSWPIALQPLAQAVPPLNVCSQCCKLIEMGQGFVRIRADRTKADMVLAHDTCHPDPLLKRRVMNEKVLDVIQQYGA